MISPNSRSGRYSAAISCCLIVIGCICAEAQSKSGWSAAITHENDAFSLNGRNDHYTAGWKLEVFTGSLYSKALPFLSFRHPDALHVQRLFAGAYGFTPQVVDLTDIDIYDRPYSSYSYVGAGQTSYDLDRGLVWNSDLKVGVIGMQKYGEFQKWYSGATGATQQVGWANQLEAPGKFAFSYSASITKNTFHSSQMFLRFFLRNIHHEVDTLNAGDVEEVHVDTVMNDRQLMKDLANLYAAEVGFEFLQTRWTAGANIGTLANNLFVTWRVNLMNVNRYSLLNYIPSYINEYGPLHATDHRHHGIDKVRFHIFLRPSVKLVGTNAMLTGLPFGGTERYHIDPADVKRVLFEMEAGFDLTLWQNFDFVYTWSGRSREFEGGPRFNTWGLVSVGYSPRSWNPIK